MTSCVLFYRCCSVLVTSDVFVFLVLTCFSDVICVVLQVHECFSDVRCVCFTGAGGCYSSSFIFNYKYF